MDFETRAIHAGQDPDPTTGSAITPIYQTTTYVQDAVGKNKGYDYSRAANPTRTALEVALASLENGEHGLAYASFGTTACDPGLSTVRSSVSSAASPLANASPRVPRSRAARQVSRAVRVGLPDREYSYPWCTPTSDCAYVLVW
jgi:hypothetical protein